VIGPNVLAFDLGELGVLLRAGLTDGSPTWHLPDAEIAGDAVDGFRLERREDSPLYEIADRLETIAQSSVSRDENALALVEAINGVSTSIDRFESGMDRWMDRLAR
jgi:hypothetical protein